MNCIRKAALAALIFLGPSTFGGFAGTNSASTGSPAGKIQPRQIMRSGYNRFTRMVDAVIIDEGPLVHTAQILPWGNQGEIVGIGDASIQAARVVDNLMRALKAGGAISGGIIKVNIYVAQAEVIPKVREAMARGTDEFDRVALSFVTGRLTEPGALVAMDAVAVAELDTENHAVNRTRARALPFMKGTAAAILPGGGKYYVSGQAKNGPLPDATRDTLASLENTLIFLGLGKSNVVQVKAFMQPISEAASVQAEIAKFFGPELPPPTVFVEWTNAPATPIEIELIAADNKEPVLTGDSVDFLTPPGFAVSRVFSRVAHVNHGRMIYFSGFYGNSPGSAATQLNDIYVYMDYLLPRLGTDFDHLVKATYYVTNQEASSKLDDIRPKFYNPQRPPAASRAMVAGVGIPERSVTIDMIAVTR